MCKYNVRDRLARVASQFQQEARACYARPVHHKWLVYND